MDLVIAKFLLVWVGVGPPEATLWARTLRRGLVFAHR